MIYHQAPGGSGADIILIGLRERESILAVVMYKGPSKKAANMRLFEIVF